MRSVLCRWGLLAVLALSVVVMHHAPGEHEPSHASPAGHAAPAALAMSGHDDSHFGTELSAPIRNGGSPAPDHSLLHLCLAIVVGLSVLAARFLIRGLRPPAPEPNRLVRGGLGRFPPPAPVPRRLAVLCVLRR